MANEFAIQGLDGVLKKLRTLPDKLRRRALRAAVRKGANIVRDAARTNAKQVDDPATPEQIAKNITAQFSAKQSRQVGGVVIRVGVLGGARQYGNTKENVRKRRVGQTYKTAGDKGNPGGDTWYWRFVELGTSRVRARPFLRPALEGSAERATDAIVAELNKQLDRLVATNAAQ